VLTADHGESLGEHDYVGHGRHLYENIIRIPLIIRMPNQAADGQVIATPVSLLDVTPTITDLTVKQELRRKKVALRFRGRSLADALTKGTPLRERRIYIETFPGKKGFAPSWLSWAWIGRDELPLLFGYIDGDSKLIWSPEDEMLKSYDLSSDAGETGATALGRGTPPYASATAQLRTWFSRTESRAGEQRLSQRDLQVLKSLGYVQ
jgi:arylsulfatase A-like enzyme